MNGYLFCYTPAMRSAKKKPLPAGLRRFFWEYRFGSLSWQRDRELIMQRVLAHGDWDSIRWLRRRLRDDQLAEWLMRRRGAGLSPQQLRYWELILNLPRRRVTAWLMDPGRQVWDERLKA